MFFRTPVSILWLKIKFTKRSLVAANWDVQDVFCHTHITLDHGVPFFLDPKNPKQGLSRIDMCLCENEDIHISVWVLFIYGFDGFVAIEWTFTRNEHDK